MCTPSLFQILRRILSVPRPFFSSFIWDSLNFYRQFFGNVKTRRSALELYLGCSTVYRYFWQLFHLDTTFPQHFSANWEKHEYKPRHDGFVIRPGNLILPCFLGFFFCRFFPSLVGFISLFLFFFEKKEKHGGSRRHLTIDGGTKFK